MSSTFPRVDRGQLLGRPGTTVRLGGSCRGLSNTWDHGGEPRDTGERIPLNLGLTVPFSRTTRGSASRPPHAEVFSSGKGLQQFSLAPTGIPRFIPVASQRDWIRQKRAEFRSAPLDSTFAVTGRLRRSLVGSCGSCWGRSYLG